MTHLEGARLAVPCGRWVERTAQGSSYRTVEWSMPAIPDQYLESVVFLYESEEKARQANTLGGGTGFFVSMPLVPHRGAAFYIVTNRHCAEFCPTMRLRTKHDEWRYIRPGRGEWIDHPDGDDLSAYPIELGPDFAQPKSILVWPMMVERPVVPGVVPGSDAFFAGRYTTVSGINKNTPMLRFGNVAMMPTPIEAEGGRYQESFVVEARSRGGFSGSPVFAYSLQTSSDEIFARFGSTFPSHAAAKARNIEFLGVVWGHLPEWEPVYSDKVRRKDLVLAGHWVTHNSNLACVVPAWKVVELLNRRELEEMRERLVEERQSKAAVHDFAGDEEAAESEFDRFEDLTRKLVNVPKKEIDEKRGADK